MPPETSQPAADPVHESAPPDGRPDSRAESSGTITDRDPGEQPSGTRHLTVVLPAYNEAVDLPPLLRRLEAVMAGLDRPHRIVVVDDGSTDGTAAAARETADELTLEVVEHPENRGLGAALSTGLVRAMDESGVVVTMDADNSHAPELIPKMIDRIEDGADVVIGSRFQDGARVQGVPWHRRFLSLGVRGLMRAVAGIPGVRDYSSGFRAYRASVLRRAVEIHGPEHLVEEKGFACMLELLLKLAVQGVEVTEVPLDLRYDEKRGESKMRVVHTIGGYGTVLAGQDEWGRRVPVPERADPTGSIPGGLGLRAREFGRRVLNLGLAAVGLIMAAPVMLVIAAAVKVQFEGSVLVRMKRIGLDRRSERSAADDERRRRDYGGRPFPMYKFRTVGGAGGEHTQPVVPPDDPTVPALGRLLRKFRLDELPQLVNVLRGDMNLVGPRPRAPEISIERREDIDVYSLRNLVRPGITGWAQVHPPRQISPDDSRRDLPLDLEYLEGRSPLRDLKIIVKTIPVILLRRGAW